MPNEPPVLTAEQIEVLDDLANGLTYKQIAYQRGRQLRSVSLMLRRAMITLGAETPMQGIALFVAHFGLPEQREEFCQKKQ